MPSMFVTELTSQPPMGWLKALAAYSAARDRLPHGVSRDLGARGKGTADDDNTATLEQQQHAGWKNTYEEHAFHGRHRAHVPISDGLIEGIGFLHLSEGRVAVWSEPRCWSEGTGDRGRPPTTTQRRKRSNTRDGGART
jgi:hypothetical protein